MADISNLSNYLKDVADAIRTKKETTGQIPAENFDSEILSIETGIDTSDATANANDLALNKTAYVNGKKVTGTIPELTPYTGVITMNQNGIGSDGDGTIGYLNSSIDKDTIVRKGTNVAIMADNDSIADMIGLTADKIVKGNSFLGIEGTAEAGTTNGVKLFETEEQMQADTNANEGDLAVVYRNEVQNVTVDSRFQVATFPDTVVLDTAMTDYVNVRYRAVDSSKMFDCWGSLNSSNFSMNCYTETGEIRIQYTSSDGITYTRTRMQGNSGNLENPVDFGTEIYYENAEMWNDAIGKFIQLGGMVFEGLYEYKSHSSDELIEGLTSVVSPSSYQTSTVEISDIQRVVELVEDKFNTDVGLGNHPSREYLIIKINNIYRVYFGIYIDSTYGNTESSIGLLFADNKSYTTFGPFHTGTDMLITDNLADTNGTTCKPYCYDVDIINETVTDTQLSTSSFTQITVGSNIKMKGPELTNLGIIIQYNVSNSGSIAYNVSYITSSESSGTIKNAPTTVMDYLLADTQLTLSNSNELLPGKIAYGENGVITGDGSIMIPNTTFADAAAMLSVNIQRHYDNMSVRILTDDDRNIDENVYTIPTKSDGTPLIDTGNLTTMENMFIRHNNLVSLPVLNTSNVKNLSYTFNNCVNLVSVPLIDTSNVTNMSYTFYNCKKLTSIPLLDTSSVTVMENMFRDCTNLVEIPLFNTINTKNMICMFYGCTSLTSIPELNTINATDLGAMFYGCTSLTEIPLLNTSKCSNLRQMFYGCNNLVTVPELSTNSVVKYIDNIFYGCTSLSDESLNNILAMCKNATSYNSTKTLSYIGLTSEQANKCKALSNYSAFTSAGWTTGY